MKKEFVVDIYKTMVKTVCVKAETFEEAYQKAKERAKEDFYCVSSVEFNCYDSDSMEQRNFDEFADDDDNDDE